MKKNTMNNATAKINWALVDSIPEENYDYDEAPEATLKFFQTANIRIPHTSKPITLRVKQDTLEFFKNKTKHYQTLINSVLDAYVMANRKNHMPLV